MHNVWGVRNLDHSHARCSCFFKLPSTQLNTQPSRSRVLRVYRGPNLGKTARASATICSLCSLRPRTAQTKGLRSHRCSWRTVSPDIFGAPGAAGARALFLGLAQQRSAPCMAQARGLLSVY